jgi:hypothetical protein
VFFDEHTAHPGRIATGVSTDMSHPNFHVFDRERQYFRASAQDHTTVDIPSDGTHHGRNAFEAAYNINVANVAGVPNLIAVLEMQSVSVIPAGVSVGEDTYFFHLRKPSFLAMSAGIAFLLT